MAKARVVVDKDWRLFRYRVGLLFMRCFGSKAEHVARWTGRILPAVLVVILVRSSVDTLIADIVSAIAALVGWIIADVAEQALRRDLKVAAFQAVGSARFELPIALGFGGTEWNAYSTAPVYDQTGLYCLVDTETRIIGDLTYEDGILLNDLRLGPGLVHITVTPRWRGNGTEVSISVLVNAAFDGNRHGLRACIFRMGEHMFIDNFADGKMDTEVFIPDGNATDYISAGIAVFERENGAILSSLDSLPTPQLIQD